MEDLVFAKHWNNKLDLKKLIESYHFYELTLDSYEEVFVLQNDILVAYAAVYRNDIHPSVNRCIIIVSKKNQRKKIGTKIIKYIFTKFNDLDVIIPKVRPDIISFFDSLNFRVIQKIYDIKFKIQKTIPCSSNSFKHLNIKDIKISTSISFIMDCYEYTHFWLGKTVKNEEFFLDLLEECSLEKSFCIYNRNNLECIVLCFNQENTIEVIIYLRSQIKQSQVKSIAPYLFSVLNQKYNSDQTLFNIEIDSSNTLLSKLLTYDWIEIVSHNEDVRMRKTYKNV